MVKEELQGNDPEERSIGGQISDGERELLTQPEIHAAKSQVSYNGVIGRFEERERESFDEDI